MLVHFSCKITNAVLSDLENRGEDLSALYDPAFPPTELLRDPNAWMSAPDMEVFLETLVSMNWARVDGSILIEAGRTGPKNHVWGVLDSVLRMMPRPQEILHQPERFLSYFISPEPPIENLSRSEDSISFDLPLPAQQYPHVTAYLKAAFEALPLYTGGERARCEWTDIHLKIVWPERPTTMFETDPGHQISPDLLQTVIHDHQRLLRELEEKNREIQRKDEELETLRRSAGKAPYAEPAALDTLAANGAASNHAVSQNLARLHDYMVRAQQLITVLSGLAKKEPGVKEAFRRLDWDHVKAQYPRVLAESFESLRRLQSRHAPNLPSDNSHEEQPHV